MGYDIIIVGGGAAGFFAAIQAAEMISGVKILIVEKTPKLLSKVKVSGGGRCNVTHSCFDAKKLPTHYPRGQKFLKPIFNIYQAKDVVDWFEGKGVKLKTEGDGRMFPISDDSRTIIECFMQLANAYHIKIEIGCGVIGVKGSEGEFEVLLQSGKSEYCRHLIVASGGTPSPAGYDWIAALGHSIISPIPSLFTFNDSEKKFKDLMGISVSNAEVKIEGTKLSSIGPLLITHWGLSGPAVIRLSAWAAEYLHEVNYKFNVLVSWMGPIKEEEIRNILLDYKSAKGKQKVMGNPLFNLPQRLWFRLCKLAEVSEVRIWAELPLRNLNKLIEYLIRCPFRIEGKTTFKEEFVTCGGVDLNYVNPTTMESKLVKGLYFAGEVLNIDGETGGFNFQAAWSTGYLAARSIAKTNELGHKE